jgi:hypothetical protein
MHSETPTVQIAALPATPGQPEPLPLTLTYDQVRREGTFHYGPHLLRMSCRIAVTRTSRGSRNSQSSSVVERSGAESIPCDWLWAWLRHGANWPAEDRFDDGEFAFDGATQSWHNRKLRRRVEAVYHDTHYETIVIDLRFDLVRMQGSLSSVEEFETVD